MNFTGRLVHSVGVEERITITAAEITPERIALDWQQDGKFGHLIARSPSGHCFQGKYRSARDQRDVQCEFWLFHAPHEDLLYGTWGRPDGDPQGTLIIRLPKHATDLPRPESLGQEPNEETGELPLDEAAVQKVSVEEPPFDLDPPVATPPAARSPAAKTPATHLPAAPIEPAVPVSQSARLGPSLRVPPAMQSGASSQADHLLTIDADEWQHADSLAIEAELRAAPISALFKISHNAAAAEIRALAARIFADRYGDVPAAEAPRPAARKESAEMKAYKRRSSRRRK